MAGGARGPAAQPRGEVGRRHVTRGPVYLYTVHVLAPSCTWTTPPPRRRGRCSCWTVTAAPPPSPWSQAPWCGTSPPGSHTADHPGDYNIYIYSISTLINIIVVRFQGQFYDNVFVHFKPADRRWYGVEVMGIRGAVIGGERSRDPQLTSDWSRWEEDSTPRKRVYVEEKNGRKIFKVEKIKRL